MGVCGSISHFALGLDVPLPVPQPYGSEDSELSWEMNRQSQVLESPLSEAIWFSTEK